MDEFTERRRLSFGAVAEQYDRTRPRYPEQLVTDVVDYARGPLATGSPERLARTTPLRILEVGAGTGIASAQFVPHASELVALEPDPAMASIARRRAQASGAPITVLLTDFEHASLPDNAFDLIVSATAWHWVDPARRYELAGAALRAGGALAAFWNHPQWLGSPVRSGFDRAYASVAAEFHEGDQMRPGDDDHRECAETEWREQAGGDREFGGEPEIRRYRWQQRYTAAQYVALLGTHSSHNLLPDDAKARLFAGVSDAIERNGGGFELTYETLLCLARRR